MSNFEFPEAKYISPSGGEFSFQYESVEKDTDLKTAAFTFPEKDGAYIQSLGRGGRRFPFTCIISGADCQARADAFEAALEERGVGNLKHPVYGERKVVPTGSIKREDGVVQNVNCVFIDVVFSETLVDEKMLTSVSELSSEIEVAADKFVEAAVEEFTSSISIANTSDAIALVATLEKQQKAISDTVAKILDNNSRNSVETLKDKVNAGYKMLTKATKEASKKIDQIGVYANGAMRLLRFPAQVVSSTLQVYESFGSMVGDIIRNFSKDPIGLKKIKNNYLSAKMTIQGALLSVCESCTFACGKSAKDGGFKSREEAIAAAEAVQAMSDSINQFCDSKIEKNLFIENEDSYTALLEVEKKSIALILNTAFSLRNRRIIKLGRDRQLIELLYELYGDIDGHIDEFITDNKLNFDTIAIIPMGAEVTYYV